MVSKIFFPKIAPFMR